MACIALKVDVDTLRGTREGVPRLLTVLRLVGAHASFLFSLGPDHTGRAILRVFRPGFLSKVARTSVLEHYGLRTLMYGVLLPGPDIGRCEAGTLRAVRDAGFEVGVHCWDHVEWQDRLLLRDPEWARRQMQLAVERHTEIFGSPPRVHGAAGWQFNAAAAQAETALGIKLASDTRGAGPFIPVADDGRPIGPPQYPTTLPTLDELIGVDGIDADNVHAHLLSLTVDPDRDHVYTLHAELEGMKLMPAFERLLRGWRAQGHSLVSIGDLASATEPAELPRHLLAQGEVAGRSGRLAVQGAAWSDAVRQPEVVTV
ncbi:polysaccharide deacetylase family protein [Variovorax sp. J2P1-59]|uniref:polysaccharide deacetylase family protein n=1 Tax=Variovorax flavidus TaxID=3053501 RepID=UPI002577FCEB|nr:polysaccharide deacetylase family protein [Variovorax sp. J2P1-59]MDM0073427.1 polysaccharide deacetylase family protein [Variovorax sp. J2P1-59]